MRVLVLGYGSMGRRHAANAKAFGHEVMVHDAAWAAPIHDSSADPYLIAANKGGARGWSPDAVVIATPASTHVELIREWWPKPVLCEKPLALSAVDFNGEGDPNEYAVQVGCNWRQHALVKNFRSIWSDAPFAAQCPERAFFWCFCDMRSWPGASYSDALLEIGAHEIDLALHLFGPARLRSAVRMPNDMRWTLTLEHEGGTACEIVLVGDEESEPRRGLRATWGGHRLGYDVEYGPLEDAALAASYRAEMEAFLGAVAHGGPLSPSLAEGLAVLRICDEARATAVGGRGA